MALVSNPKDGDDVSVRQAIARLSSTKLGPTSTPTFASITTDILTTATLTISGLTASRLIATNASKALTSVDDLTSWVAGTADEIVVTDDTDGTITLSLGGSVGDISDLTPTDGYFIVGDGTNWVTESGDTARISLGVGSTDDVEFQSLLVDQNTDAIGLTIESAATTDTNFGLSVTTTAGAMVASFLNGDGNAGQCYLGLLSNNGFSGTYFFARNLTAASTDCAVVYMVQDHADDDQPLLELKQDGTGPALLVTSGSISIAEGVTVSSGITVPDDGYIGSVSEPQAIQIEADGDVVFHQAIDVPSDIVCGGHVSFDLDNGHIGYIDNSPIITFNDTDDQIELTGSLIHAEQFYMLEQAAAAADKDGYGQLWVKNTTPNELWFTDDASTDFQLNVAGGAIGGDDTQIQFNDDGAFGASENFTFDKATNIADLNGTIQVTRLLAGGVTA